MSRRSASRPTRVTASRDSSGCSSRLTTLTAASLAWGALRAWRRTGQAGARWPGIRDLILEELADRHVPTTVYVLPDEPMPEDAPADDQLSLL